MNDLLQDLSTLSPVQRALFELLSEKRKGGAPRSHQPPPIPRRTGEVGTGDWPLSFDQERLWFLYHLDPRSTAYNIETATLLSGKLDLAAVERSLNEIVRRHAIWRTTFPAVDGPPVQRVAERLTLNLPLVDLTGLAAERRELAAGGLQEDEMRRPFDLQAGPLVRATLIRLKEREHICLLTVHHIVTDWVSFQLFWRELAALYEAFRAGRPSPLPEPPVHYADFAIWQREWMAGEILRDYTAYWLERLAGVPQFLDLPVDRPRPPVQTMRGGRHTVRLGRHLTGELRAGARRAGVTLFMALMAVCQALLGRYSGQENVVMGSPNANRNRPEIEPLLGFFLTQIVFSTDLSGDPTFRELLARVRKVTLEAFAHQELPFGKLVQALQPERDFGRPPLVQAVLLLLDGLHGQQSVPDLNVQPVPLSDGNARYDLMFALYEMPDTIVGHLEFNADVFDATTIGRLLEVFHRMAGHAVADPDVRLSQLPVFSDALRQQVLVEWNDTGTPIDAIPTLAQLFENQVERTPGAVAWSGTGWSFTYAELNRRANRLARYLRRLGVGPDTLVGLYLERTADLVVALLAVLKTGGAYLPLDISHPADRRDLLLQDAGISCLLTEQRLLCVPGPDVRLVCLDTERREIEQESGDNFLTGVEPEHLAYVIYTSGSTGRPKGVQIPHRALTHLVLALQDLWRAGAADVMPALTTVAFDMAVPELYLALVTGGRTPLLDRETAGDGPLLAQALEEHGVTILQAAPPAWRLLLASGWPGSPELLLLCGAEALSRELADALLSRGRGLWNLYGPTETTVWSIACRVTPGPGPVLIGRPLAGTRVCLLDRHLAPVPLGASGEIFIGGAGVARGYLGRPELTAERFVPDGLSGRPGERLYRTGDLARQRTDGQIELLGRIDHQVKIRGFRIEPGEIETALRGHPDVGEAVVVAREGAGGEKSLVAYVVPRHEAAPGQALPASGLRTFLKERLPKYMVPTAFVFLPTLPLTPNGKVDRRVLPPPGGAQPAAEDPHVAPRTPLEAAVAEIWCESLGLERIGVHDNFVDLGGHSLLSVQVAARLERRLGVSIQAREIMMQTLGQVTAVLEERLGQQAKPGTWGQRLLREIKDRIPHRREDART